MNGRNRQFTVTRNSNRLRHQPKQNSQLHLLLLLRSLRPKDIRCRSDANPIGGLYAFIQARPVASSFKGGGSVVNEHIYLFLALLFLYVYAHVCMCWHQPGCNSGDHRCIYVTVCIVIINSFWLLITLISLRLIRTLHISRSSSFNIDTNNSFLPFPSLNITNLSFSITLWLEYRYQYRTFLCYSTGKL